MERTKLNPRTRVKFAGHALYPCDIALLLERLSAQFPDEMELLEMAIIDQCETIMQENKTHWERYGTHEGAEASAGAHAMKRKYTCKIDGREQSFDTPKVPLYLVAGRVGEGRYEHQGYMLLMEGAAEGGADLVVTGEALKQNVKISGAKFHTIPKATY
jgi:hypothetical protein